MIHPTVAILDFGSQYTQVIARRVREANVHSRVYKYDVGVEQLKADNVIGIILSGGPASVYADNAPKPSFDVFGYGVPVLGICYGLQFMADSLGGKVEPSSEREYGHTSIALQTHSRLFEDISPSVNVWNSHGDKITKLPEGFESIAATDNAPYAAIEDSGRHFYGMQFHPEVAHSQQGVEMIHNFLYKICGCEGDWQMSAYAQEMVEEIREAVGDKHVVLGLSGGVDSSVAAALIHKAIGDQLTCVFVDNGLLRKNEREEVERLFGDHFHMDLKVVDASERFLSELDGVVDPEQKRKIIGRLFVDIFQETVEGMDEVEFLAQGTIYPDVIESVPVDGNPSAVIKSHHNVGGLPESLRLKLLEPLRDLFKDEVRKLGEELELPHKLLWRHPFPGPGLGVRVIGEVRKEYCDLLREADAIFIEEMHKGEVYYDHWQSFCVFLPVKTVGVMGDNRTHGYTIALRSVDSIDAMTADWSRLSYNLLQKVSSRIINEVEGISRVVYDISSKPPSTIEWE